MFSQGKSNSRAIVTAYFGTETFTIKKQETDKESRILIIDIFNNDSEYILRNLYHANSEKQSNRLIEQIVWIIGRVWYSPKKQLLMLGD